jgi:hypothetical protein
LDKKEFRFNGKSWQGVSRQMFDERTTRGSFRAKELEWILMSITKTFYTILDVCYNPIRHLVKLKKLCYSVIRYNLSPSFRYLSGDNLLGVGLALMQGDISLLPFRNNRFDLVLMLDILYPIENRVIFEEAVNDACRKFLNIPLKSRIILTVEKLTRLRGSTPPVDAMSEIIRRLLRIREIIRTSNINFNARWSKC